jgi:hypothetical protein
MNDEKHKILTQNYSTWGDKLLQHTDVLYEIQHNRKFKPITIQLAPCEACDSDCPFCSVAGRPLKSYMKFSDIVKCLQDFKLLGAKSVEITGGGNPMLYRDRETKQDINDIIDVAHNLGYDIGIITNSNSLAKLNPISFDKLNWVRISLIKLDEGYEPEDYDFNGFPYKKLGFSYIIYDECTSSPIRKKYYEGTSEKTIEKIAKLVELHDGNIKFVRFAGDCLIRGNNALVRQKFQDIVDKNDMYKKFFIKTIDNDDVPYDDACYVGLIRPYIAAPPDGQGPHCVYICTSHVLTKRTYDKSYALCTVDKVIETWDKLNERFKQTGTPYEVNNNGGKCWSKTCDHCFYKFNNKIIHTVASELEDKNFP